MCKLQKMAGEGQKYNKCDCGCPTRPPSPPPPAAYPSHLAGNVAELNEYLLNHYGSTVLNTCECQILPLLLGPPLRLQIPGEPPKADFSTTEIRHSILDSLAIIETAKEDMDKLQVWSAPWTP